MESPYFVWKKQRPSDFAKSPELDYYGKPLPPTPPGIYWEKIDGDAKWELKRALDNSKVNDGNRVVFSSSSVIEHVVMPHDTLQGLCLRYRVSANTIRRVNMFSGSAIQFKKVLRIPIESGVAVELQVDSHDLLLQKFRNETGEGLLEARVYMEDAAWDLSAALAAWRQEESWEQIKYLEAIRATLTDPSQRAVAAGAAETMDQPNNSPTVEVANNPWNHHEQPRQKSLPWTWGRRMRSNGGIPAESRVSTDNNQCAVSNVAFSKDVGGDPQRALVVAPAAVRIPQHLLPSAIAISNQVPHSFCDTSAVGISAAYSAAENAAYKKESHAADMEFVHVDSAATTTTTTTLHTLALPSHGQYAVDELDCAQYVAVELPNLRV